MINLKTLESYQFIQGALQVESISMLNGANYFSGEKVIRFRINLCTYDEVYTNAIEGFFEDLKNLIPTLYQHRCSLKKVGGFYERVKEGTLLGHVIEHVAIELQTMAGMNVGFGKTRITKEKGVYNVVFRFFDETAGIYAGIAAVNLVNSILQKIPFNVTEIIENLVTIREIKMLGYSTQTIVDEAEKRNIPWLRLDKYNLVQLGTGKYRKMIQATISGDTSLIAVELTDNKYKTNSILKEYGVPVPKRILATSADEAVQFFKELNNPVVIKPSVGGYQGKRVSVNLQDEATIKSAFVWAKEFDNDVIVQEFIQGKTYRVLVIDDKHAATALLEAPQIKGDGIHTVQELVDLLNTDPLREKGDKGKLSKVIINEDTLKIIGLRGFVLESVLPEGETIILIHSGNMKLGSSATDVTDVIHPYNIFICERICKILNLNVGGIDIISEDISKPLYENGACIIEVNAAPDFRIHLNPTIGESRKVQEQFINMLFPKGAIAHVPVISVTGSSGKTLTAKIIKNALQKLQYNIGLVCTEGVFINENLLKAMEGFDPALNEVVLKDPSIDCAVIESNVETILQYGLGYKFADIAIILNLDESKIEYYEYDHIKDIVDIAYAKSVIAEEVFPNGYTILNADNDLIFEMSDRLYSKVVYFTSNPLHEDVLIHTKNKGIAVVLNGDKLIVYNNLIATELMHFSQIPITSKSQEPYYKDCILGAIAALVVFGVPLEQIKVLLSTPE